MNRDQLKSDIEELTSNIETLDGELSGMDEYDRNKILECDRIKLRNLSKLMEDLELMDLLGEEPL